MSVLLTRLPFLENVCSGDFSREFPAFTVCGRRRVLRAAGRFSCMAWLVTPVDFCPNVSPAEGTGQQEQAVTLENALPLHLE